MGSKVKALKVQADADGQYDGQINSEVNDQIKVAAGHSVTIDHFEKVGLFGNDVVTLLDSGDKGTLQLSVNGNGNSVFLANAQDYNASLKGGSGATIITGVVGANLVLHGQSTDSSGHTIAFDTDGTINVSGALSKAAVNFTSLQGDATVEVHGNVSVSFADVATYTVGANGEIVISENGHSVTVEHNKGESSVFHDASGDSLSYAKLVGVIETHDGAFIG